MNPCNRSLAAWLELGSKKYNSIGTAYKSSGSGRSAELMLTIWEASRLLNAMIGALLYLYVSVPYLYHKSMGIGLYIIYVTTQLIYQESERRWSCWKSWVKVYVSAICLAKSKSVSISQKMINLNVINPQLHHQLHHPFKSIRNKLCTKFYCFQVYTKLYCLSRSTVLDACLATLWSSTAHFHNIYDYLPESYPLDCIASMELLARTRGLFTVKLPELTTMGSAKMVSLEGWSIYDGKIW